MPDNASLQIDFAYRSEAGAKEENADACNARAPEDAQTRRFKGIAACIADGVSSSEGGRQAAQTCVNGFLSDYYSTPDSWTVKTASAKVLGAINRWLFGQGHDRYDSPRGMVTTFSALVIKSSTAHITHVGDSRIWLYRDGELEQLTRDHRVWVAKDQEFLARAMGADLNLDIDYRSIAVEPGDLFLFTTDGVHDYFTQAGLAEALREGTCQLQACANHIVETALKHGSTDNVTCQLLRVLALGEQDQSDLYQRISELPFPPPLSPGMKIDGYEILRTLHASKRSEVFLALDQETGDKVVLKTPSENFRDDPDFLDAFLHEEWVGRRLDNPHLLKVLDPQRRRFLYNISEYAPGTSLAQWINDQGPASLQQARDFATQIAAGLRALHKLEMYHQDLKPDNVMVDEHGAVRLIDYGATHIAGMDELGSKRGAGLAQGTLNYAAPECLCGEACNKSSDLYSLGVVTYELLTGELPYPETDRKCRSGHYPSYKPARRINPEVPYWVDRALEKAVNPDPRKRYQMLSEFIADLGHPNPQFMDEAELPLLQRNPLAFWRWLAAGMFVGNLVLLYLLQQT